MGYVMLLGVATTHMPYMYMYIVLLEYYDFVTCSIYDDTLVNPRDCINENEFIHTYILLQISHTYKYSETCFQGTL